MNILITGGAGFIGSHLCKKYLDEGHRVFCVDNLQTTSGSKRNIEPFLTHKNFEFIRADITESFDTPKEIDWIFNLACSGSPSSYQYDPVHTTKTNTIGVIKLLELAKKHKARILQASTSEVYGDPLVSPQAESYKGNVSTLGPRACYDEGKRVAETLCMDYHREYGVDVKIIRIFNTYGPNMDPNDGRAVTNFVVRALDGKDLIVYGDGSFSRSFQYVDDLIEGIDRMMKKAEFVGPVNLGNPDEFTICELADMVLEETGSSAGLTFVEEATDDPRQRCPDISLAKQELDWEPQTKLKNGLKQTIEYFKTVARPEKRVLVFTTTYYPDVGPAEQALCDLAEAMPDTHFDLITSRFRGGLKEIEEQGNVTIHRVGFGNSFDKFWLPFAGKRLAIKLQRQNPYLFIWSVMVGYGGLAALRFKNHFPNTSLLISLDDAEYKKLSGSLFSPLYRHALKKADSVYVSDGLKDSAILRDVPSVYARGGDAKSFMSRVRLNYSDLLNQRGKKLNRYK